MRMGNPVLQQPHSRRIPRSRPVGGRRGRPHHPPGPKRLRALLAYLLLHANEPISSDRLIDEVWALTLPRPQPPRSRTTSPSLRKAIGSDLLLSQPPGYVLRSIPEHFDLARFERLVAEAQRAEPRDTSGAS